MEITEVRIKLMDDPHDRLQAFCSVTFNECFVIRDLKIIQGAKGSFVAMPSRKLTDRCPRCHTKNHLRAHYCNQCGSKLDDERAIKDAEGRAKLYADIAHPINSDCRVLIQERVLEAFAKEIVKAQQPDYRCCYDDYGEDRYATLFDSEYDDSMERVSTNSESQRRVDSSEQSVPAPRHHYHRSGNGAERTGHDDDPSDQKVYSPSHISTNSDDDEEDAFGAGLL